MAKPDLRTRIRQGLFLLDGAMGTELIARGVGLGMCNEHLNLDSPATVLDVHRAYIRAGSDAILTNTFGANRYALGRHGYAAKVEQINTAGARIACQAAGEKNYVLGDIGPSGDFLEPLGNLKAAELKEAFGEQAKSLIAGGVDGFIIETMTALDELAAAIEAVKSVGDELPIFASMSFDRAGQDYRTMMGVDVPSAVSKMVLLGVDAVGFNCGTASIDEYAELAERYVRAIKGLNKEQATGHKSRVTIFAEPNAGKPELIDGKAVYAVSPEDFAAAAERIYSAGVSIIGGCCGTGPAHIAAVAGKLK